MNVPGVVQPKLVQRLGWKSACTACSSRTMPLHLGRVEAAIWRPLNVHRSHTTGCRRRQPPRSRQRPSCTSGRPAEVCLSETHVCFDVWLLSQHSWCSTQPDFVMPAPTSAENKSGVQAHELVERPATLRMHQSHPLWTGRRSVCRQMWCVLPSLLGKPLLHVSMHCAHL